MRNIERKCTLRDRAATEALLTSLGAEKQWERWQRDTFFEVPRGWLKLREQQNSPPELIAYWRATDCADPRPSDYDILPVPDAARVCEFLQRSCPVEVVVEKERALWRWRHTRIHLDQVRGLGSFLELETLTGEIDGDQAHHECVQLGSMLELDRESNLAVPYRTLLLERSCVATA